MRRGTPRSGSILILVVGLSMVLLGLAITFIMRMRADAQETNILVQEAQCRLMFHAAVMYLQESSRLGWGEECYGWTDVRDGSLGPRPAMQTTQTDQFGQPIANTTPSGAVDGTYSQTPAPPPSQYNIPVPTWWSSTWPQYRAFPNETDSSQFPTSSQRTWPCPGSVGRFPMAVPVQPPYATQLRVSYNPLSWPTSTPEYPQPGWDQWWENPTGWSSYWTGLSPVSAITQAFNTAAGSTGMLDPQPQANLWYDPSYTGAPGQTPDFISGAIQPGVTQGDWPHVVDNGQSLKPVQLAVQPGTENLCWFRIYRELQSDHDNSGKPAYNHVALYDPQGNPGYENWNVFVIAAGAGPTRGYRFWDINDLQAWEQQNNLSGFLCRGQDFAVNSPYFSNFDVNSFHALLAASRVLWFRVEWSALQGGALDSAAYGASETKQGGGLGIGHSNYVAAYAFPNMLRIDSPKLYGGNLRWIQRLDHEPPNW